jgi:hypothetical protein
MLKTHAQAYFKAIKNAKFALATIVTIAHVRVETN